MGGYQTMNETICESADGRRRAVLYRAAHGQSGFRVCCEENPNSKFDYDVITYGDTAPLTRKMADEIADRFCNGKKIPKRLEWR
jgi:hypothetical protein